LYVNENKVTKEATSAVPQGVPSEPLNEFRQSNEKRAAAMASAVKAKYSRHIGD
jgi:hypothetical protein